jgi:hypothetical protein
MALAYGRGEGRRRPTDRGRIFEALVTEMRVAL